MLKVIFKNMEGKKVEEDLEIKILTPKKKKSFQVGSMTSEKSISQEEIWQKRRRMEIVREYREDLKRDLEKIDQAYQTTKELTTMPPRLRMGLLTFWVEEKQERIAWTMKRISRYESGQIRFSRTPVRNYKKPLPGNQTDTRIRAEA